MMQWLKTLFHSKNIFGAIIAKGGSSSEILVFYMGKTLLRRGRHGRGCGGRRRRGIDMNRGNVSTHIILFFILFSYLKMGRTSSLGMGYRFFEMNRRLSSASDSNIVTKLASRSVTGLPIQVHQHYGLELHLIRHPNDSKETCIRRAFRTYHIAQDECLQLKKVLCKDFVHVYLARVVTRLCLTE